MEASKSGDDTKRVMFVEEQNVGNLGYQKKTTADFGQSGGGLNRDEDEEFKDDDDETNDNTEDVEEKRISDLKTNWTK